MSVLVHPSGKPIQRGNGTSLSEAIVDDVQLATAKVKRARTPHLWAITPLQECSTPYNAAMCDTPEKAYEYWKADIATDSRFNRELETMVVLMLNTRRRILGHYVVSTGTMDTLLVHPREIFRAAIIASAASIVLMHNHPSGDPTPSEADIKVTRDLKRAGELLKIEVLDHVIAGHPMENRPHGYCSLRELGYFYS